MPAAIFISHSARDVEIARLLKAALERGGLSVFMAPDDMHGVHTWPQQLAQAIDGCVAVVLLLSADANGSEHVAREVSLAISNAKPILALRLADVRPAGSLRYLLQLKQWIDIFPGQIESHFDGVLDELRTLLSEGRPRSDALAANDRRTCPNCGTLNPQPARTCSTCAASLTDAPEVRLNRRVVSILLCDIVTSSLNGEALDPEIARRLMTRYSAMARKTVANHGGVVTESMGAVVMAIFGLPTLHEDDALRAVRAAVDMQAASPNLRTELKLDPEILISIRIGITTGEIVAGDPAIGGALVTGDPVNTAARLQQAAALGEILISAPTRDLVRDAVVVESVPALGVPNKSVVAYRLLSVIPDAPAHLRRFDAPMVGRERELRRLRQAFDDAVSEKRCHLFTVLGNAGVGKSRLVTEFLAGLAGQARAVQGRCLPYGESITYWPVREIVHALAAIDEGDAAAAARGKLANLLGADRKGEGIERCVSRAIGLSDEPVGPEELTWGIRRFLELMAEDLPLVVVFDDVQWGEPTFLDLIEHLADWVRDAPLLLVCPARPELLELRPAWAGGKLNATSLLLEPLPADASRLLIDELGGAGLPIALRERVAAAAEGNALFIEEMVNMLRADGILGAEGRPTLASAELEQVRVPATIRALLAARLDSLPPSERVIAERASVIGRAFERRAVAELSPESERSELPVRLGSLVRKELMRPDRSELTEDAYRFRHLLIRDAAYDALPKSERAVLHERFARWLIAEAGDRIAEYEAVIAFHFDHAFQSLHDLGEHGQTPALASQAADWYGRAARRADAVLDIQSSSPLWERAVTLTGPTHEGWQAAAYELANSLRELGQTDAAKAWYAEVMKTAAGRDPALAAMSRIGSFRLGRVSKTEWRQEMERIVQEALPALKAHGDHRHLSAAYLVLAEVRGDNADRTAYAAALSSVVHARQTGDAKTRRVAAAGFVQAARQWLPAAKARMAITRHVDAADFVGASRMYLLEALAHLDAKEGDLPRARERLTEAIAVADRFRQPEPTVVILLEAGRKARWAGDFSSAEPLFRRASDLAAEHRLTYWAPNAQAWLAMSLCDLGRDEEAEKLLVELADQNAEDDSAAPIALVVRARLLARRGQLAGARSLLHEALERLPPLWLLTRTEARVEQINMLKEAGLDVEAALAAEAALSDTKLSPDPLYDLMINEALQGRGSTSGSVDARSMGEHSPATTRQATDRPR